MNALRTNFRKELKKVIDSERSGAGIEDMYESSLSYYDAMMFLRDQETPDKSRSLLDAETEGSIPDDNTSEHVSYFVHIISGLSRKSKCISFSFTSPINV